jgi:hypothetical protein
MERALQKYNAETSELNERIASIDNEYARKLREKDVDKEILVSISILIFVFHIIFSHSFRNRASLN